MKKRTVNIIYERMRELMKNRIKRSLALIITFAMIISMLPSNLIVAKATESAGTVRWQYQH